MAPIFQGVGTATSFDTKKFHFSSSHRSFQVSIIYFDSITGSFFVDLWLYWFILSMFSPFLVVYLFVIQWFFVVVQWSVVNFFYFVLITSDTGSLLFEFQGGNWVLLWLDLKRLKIEPRNCFLLVFRSLKLHRFMLIGLKICFMFNWILLHFD